MLTVIKKRLESAGIDPKFFDMVSQFAHFFTWYSAVLTMGMLGVRYHHKYLFMGIGLACCLLYASWHEFIWDPTHENAETRGSDWEDWSFLVIGGSIAVIIGALLLP